MNALVLGPKQAWYLLWTYIGTEIDPGLLVCMDELELIGKGFVEV